MKLKKILGITGLAVASTVALAACGAGGNKSAKDDKTLTVGIMTLDDTTEPLWDKVKELAKDKGVTMPDCGSECRRFESGLPPNKNPCKLSTYEGFLFVGGCHSGGRN